MKETENLVCPKFDAKKVKDDLVQWIRDFFDKNGTGCNAVVGISGGKDSSIVAALCVEALGKERVIGVTMPNSATISAEENIAVSSLFSHLGISHICVNISNAVQSIQDSISGNLEVSDQAKINLPARIRMSTLYAVSQSVNGRVANTCNLSEDWVGYSTRYGDSVGDFSPLSRLTVTEVKAIGYELGLPGFLIEKIPSDGLCGKSDEENLSFSYATLDNYIRTGVCEDTTVKERIDALHEKNLFKLKPMPCFEYRAT